MKNFKNASELVIATDAKINLNGYYFAFTETESGAAVVIAEGATVTLTGSGYLKVEYSAWEKFTSVIENNGTLVIEGITVNGANLFNAGAAAIVNNGTLTVDSTATITVKKAAEIIGNGTVN